MYAQSSGPTVDEAKVVKTDLARIGIAVEIRSFPGEQLFQRLFTPGEPYYLGFFLMGAAMRARQVPTVLFCVLFAGIPLLIGCATALPWAPFVHVPLGLIAGWLGWANGGDNRGPSRKSSRGTTSPWWDSGWLGGAWSSFPRRAR